MIIKELKLKNFRNFRNIDIKFATDSDKKVTVILGNNTYGKTTLVKAFLWCLYGNADFKTKSLLNKDVENNLKFGESCDVSAELKLEHNGYDYIIRTKEVYEKKNTGVEVTTEAYPVVMKTKVGQMISQNNDLIPRQQAEAEINNILRRELKDYFFFDGETNTIDNISSSKNIKGAVFDIMGMDYIKKLNDFFNPRSQKSVIAKLESEYENGRNSSHYSEISRELQEARESREQLKSDIESNVVEISKLNQKKEEDERILDGYAEIKAYQDEKKALDIENTRIGEKIEPDFIDIIRAINTENSFLKTLFASAYKKFNLETQLKESSFNNDNSYIGINEAAVNKLIKDGYCICGAEIKNGNDAYKHLVAAKEHMEPHDYGRYVSDFLGAESSNNITSKSIVSGIRHSALNLIGNITTMGENNARLTEISRHIGQGADYGQYQTEIDELKKSINRLEWDNEETQKKIEKLDIEIDTLQKQQKAETEKSAKNEFISKCIKYATEIYRESEESINKANSEMITDLQGEVQTIFDSMYTGKRKIEIDSNDSDFNVSVTAVNNDKLDSTTGLTTVKNYSFVIGLMNLAKKSANDRRYLGNNVTDNDSSDQNYPLVLDAPFSSTDSEHIKNICKVLPEYCSQVIMVLMPKDFQHAKETLGNRIGKQYQIVKQDETNSIIEEVL